MQPNTPQQRNKLFPLLNIASYIVSTLGAILFVISLIFSLHFMIKEDLGLGLVMFVFTLSASLLVTIMGVIARLLSKKIEQNQQNQSK